MRDAKKRGPAGRISREREHTGSLGNVAKGKKADHTYTNDDVTRQNDKNGDVKYDGKTEKL